MLSMMYTVMNKKIEKIICILSDYGIKKRQYDMRGVHDILLEKKKDNSRLLYIM